MDESVGPRSRRRWICRGLVRRASRPGRRMLVTKSVEYPGFPPVVKLPAAADEFTRARDRRVRDLLKANDHQRGWDRI